MPDMPEMSEMEEDDDVPWCYYDEECYDAKYKDAVKFFPDITCGKVIKVYDGDTLTIATKLSGKGPLYRFSVRLVGIDTPEKRTKNAEEKVAGYKAMNALKDKALGRIITFEEIQYDKYGRILAVPYLDGESLC